MTQDSKKIVNVAKAIYDQLGKANFTRGDVEDQGGRKGKKEASK